MGGDAVVAAVLGRHGGCNHLLLDLVEARLLLHDRVAESHKAFELGHIKGKGLEHVRDKAELLLAQLEQVGHGGGERGRLELERHDLLVVVRGTRGAATGGGGALLLLRIIALFGTGLGLTSFTAGSGHGVISLTFAQATYTLQYRNDIALASVQYGDGR